MHRICGPSPRMAPGLPDLDAAAHRPAREHLRSHSGAGAPQGRPPIAPAAPPPSHSCPENSLFPHPRPKITGVIATQLRPDRLAFLVSMHASLCRQTVPWETVVALDGADPARFPPTLASASLPCRARSTRPAPEIWRSTRCAPSTSTGPTTMTSSPTTPWRCDCTSCRKPGWGSAPDTARHLTLLCRQTAAASSAGNAVLSSNSFAVLEAVVELADHSG